ncbi:MAG: hypothetical protein ACOCV2_01740 [Persicimonas sp.]
MSTAYLRLLVAASMVSAACNLSIDVDEHPYRGRDVGSDASPPDANAPDGGADADASKSDAADGGTDSGTDSQRLIFTELMPDVTAPPDEGVEYGEYIEIKNVGTKPADPRRVIIELVDSDRRIRVDPFADNEEEQEVVDALDPIEPGEYFVFLRRDDEYYGFDEALDESQYYEYGRYSEDVPLANSTRGLKLAYQPTEFERDYHDEVAWANGELIDPSGSSNEVLPMREDVAWGVEADSEDRDANADPLNWCYHQETIGAGVVAASPAEPTPDDCTR